MASKGYISALLNKLEPDLRVVFEPIFDEVLREFRVGDSDKAQNFAWFQTEFTTHANTNTEFSVEHGMDRPPSRFIPSLRLDVQGAQLVPLVVTRAADARRVYLRSSSTGAFCTGHFE